MARPSPFPVGDLITLVVVAHSTKLTWKPQWTPRITKPMTCNPWSSRAFGPEAVAGVMLKGPLIEFTGIVDPDDTVPLDDFELGILQAGIRSKMTAIMVVPWQTKDKKGTLVSSSGA